MIDLKVNSKEFVRAARMWLITFMRRTKSKHVVMDAVHVNHCENVIDFFEDNGISVHPSNGHPHYVPGGCPPYSPDCSVLDQNALPAYKEEIHQKMRSVKITTSKKNALFNRITRTLTKQKYVKIAKNAFNSYQKRMQKIIDTGGEMTN